MKAAVANMAADQKTLALSSMIESAVTIDRWAYAERSRLVFHQKSEVYSCILYMGIHTCICTFSTLIVAVHEEVRIYYL